MTGLFRSKSCGLVGLTEFNPPPPSGGFFNRSKTQDSESTEEETEEEEFEEGDQSDVDDDGRQITTRPMSTPFIGAGARGRNGISSPKDNQFTILDMVMAVLRKSLVACSVERDDVCSMDISWPTEVRHVSHVTFDRFNGFLGLPDELQPEVPRKPPSASASVFGVSAKSMQCSYDSRGNSVPTILLMMQRRLYSEGGLTAEGIFRINAENSQEEYVRDQLNKGLVPQGIDVHCLAGLIKAWFRELPTGVLDSLTPEQVMHCNTEEDCTKIVDLLPQMEAALLDWAINLMADVVQYEQYNKMNARNIAMVFAPNMTQMADPLTALIHAVQVMNFLKTLILKTLREREESTFEAKLRPSCSNSPTDKTISHLSISNKGESCEQALHARADEKTDSTMFLRSSTLSRLEAGPEEKLWSFHKSNEEEEWVSISGGGSPKACKTAALDNGSYRGDFDGSDWLSLRKGVTKLCRHPVFQFNKPDKKMRSVGIVNTREAGGAAWV